MKKWYEMVVLAAIILMASQSLAANGDLLVDGRIGINTGTADINNGLRVKGSSWPTNTICSEGNETTAGGGFLAYNVRSTGELPYANDRLGFFYFGYNTPSIVTPLHSTGITSYAEGDWTLSSTPANFILSTTPNGSTTRTERLRITGNGYVGIGTASPQYLLDVAGPARINGTVYGTSDIRLKKNLRPMINSLDSISKLSGVSYEWKIDEYKEKGFQQGRHFGMVAQDVEKVLPEIVSTSEDGIKSIAYTELIPFLIEAVKEQQKLIQKQQKELAEIKMMLKME